MKILMNIIPIFVFIVLLIFATGCDQSSDKSEVNTMITKNESNAERTKLLNFGNSYTEAWNSQNPSNVASFFSIDGSLSVNNDPPLTGREAITKFAKGFMTSFPDMKLIMDSLVTKSSRTDYHWTFLGTNSGPNGTGNNVRFSGVERWELDEEGLIKDSQGSYDAGEYNRQVKYSVNSK